MEPDEDWIESHDDQPEYRTARAEQEADDARNPRYDLEADEVLEESAEEVGAD